MEEEEEQSMEGLYCNPDEGGLKGLDGDLFNAKHVHKSDLSRVGALTPAEMVWLSSLQIS